MEQFTDIGIKAIIIVIEFFLILLGTGLLVDYLGRQTTNNIYNTFGSTGLFITSFIGTPVHELGHLIMALIFRHHITDFKLFTFKTDGVLGYVNTQHNTNSKYQTIGCFFIGIGPIFSCLAVLLTSLYFLLPETFMKLKVLADLIFVNSSYNLAYICQNMLLILFNSSNLTSINFWLFCLIFFMVATHMSLSKADLKTASQGLIYLLILLFFIIVVTVFLGKVKMVFFFLNLVIFTCLLVIAVSAAAWLISLLI